MCTSMFIHYLTNIYIYIVGGIAVMVMLHGQLRGAIREHSFAFFMAMVCHDTYWCMVIWTIGVPQIYGKIMVE